jgi:tetratricopeptide (TPR) repeat protein
VKAHGVLWVAALLVASTTWLIEGQSGLPREDAYRHNNLGVAHLERYDFRAAADAFRQALAIEPSLTIARLNRAIARLYVGQHDAASIDVSALIAALPQSAHGHYVAGLIARAANRTADIYTAHRPRPPVAAFDHHGHEVLEAIRWIDRRYVDDFRLERTGIRGASLADVEPRRRSLGVAASAAVDRLDRLRVFERQRCRSPGRPSGARAVPPDP